MTLAQAGAIIEAVRSHPDIGTGSCSYIDETMTTLEILEEVKEAGITTPARAVAYLVSVEKTLQDHDEEMRANWRNSQ